MKVFLRYLGYILFTVGVIWLVALVLLLLACNKIVMTLIPVVFILAGMALVLRYDAIEVVETENTGTLKEKTE